MDMYLRHLLRRGANRAPIIGNNRKRAGFRYREGGSLASIHSVQGCKHDEHRVFRVAQRHDCEPARRSDSVRRFLGNIFGHQQTPEKIGDLVDSPTGGDVDQPTCVEQLGLDRDHVSVERPGPPVELYGEAARLQSIEP